MKKNWDWEFARKCPNCGSRHFERETAFSHIVQYKDGQLISAENVKLEMGHFKCLDCGLERGLFGDTHEQEF